MTIDKRLLEILRCPASGQSLVALSSAQIDAVNRAISDGSATPADPHSAKDPLRQGLATVSLDRVYRVEDGIPVMLASESFIFPTPLSLDR